MSEKAIALEVKGPAMPIPVSDEKAAVLSMIERAARDPAVDIDKLERLMTMQRQMRAEQAEMEFSAAMAACQAEMEPIRKDAYNPQTRSKYATYDALDRACRPIYTRHGFEVTFDTAPTEIPDEIMVICQITHRSGHKRFHRAPMARDGKGAKGGDVMTKTHAVGSALSYGKRYTFGLGFNITTTERDDDGNRAGGAAPTISEEQGNELRKLMEDFESDRLEGFCKHFKIEKIDDLPAVKFEEAKAAIKKSNDQLAAAQKAAKEKVASK